MRITLALLAALLFTPTAFAADGLPADVQSAIEAAKSTNNAFVVKATLEAAAKQHPEYAKTIMAHAPKPAAKKPKAVAKAPEPAKPVVAKAEEKPAVKWKGDIQASLEKRSGNTQTEEVRGKVNLERDADTWRNRFGLEGRYATEDGDTINKDYRVRYGLDYKYSKHMFVFGELDYVVDKFSGFDYRLSESIGIGHRKEWPHKKMMLDTRASMGARHYKEDAPGAKTEHEVLILKPEVTYKWQIRDNMEFQQKAESSIGQDVTITETETSFTYKINSKLGLKVAFEAEHTSSVPAGTKKLETFTSTGLVYKLFE